MQLRHRAEVTLSMLMMSDGPIITCSDVTATPGDSDVILPCSVKARPQVTSLYWTIGNETAVTDVTLGSNYIPLVRVRQYFLFVFRHCCFSDDVLYRRKSLPEFTDITECLDQGCGVLSFCETSTPTPTPSPDFRLRIQDVMCDILIVYFSMNGQKI